MTKEQIAHLVQEQLRDHHPGGVTLEVIEGDVRRRDGYWYVGVRPSAQPPRMFEYYEALADVEATLEEQKNLLVFLNPTLPEGETAGSAESAGHEPPAERKRR